MVSNSNALFRKSFFQVSNILAFLVVLVVNGLANALPLGGNATGELSDLYPNLFVPAGLTFSIWGVIYLALAAFIFYQARDLFSAKKINMPFLRSISWFFVISCLGNAGWIFAWHYRQVFLSLLAMLVLLYSLAMIYLNLDIGRKSVDSSTLNFVHLPFSLYLGWITVATIANITAVLVYYQWSGWGLSEVFWTVFVILAGTVITLINIGKRGDVAYSVVILWAYLGIIIKRYSADSSPAMEIIYTAGLGMFLIIIGLFLFRRKHHTEL